MFAITRSSTPTWSEVSTLQNRMQRLFDEAFRGWPAAREQDGGSLVGQWVPPVDVLEDKDTVRIEAELPGVKPEDVRITLENNVLTIRGEKREAREDKTEVHRYERYYGVFERSFTVPTTVDADHIKATYDVGVLTIHLPKAEKAKPRSIDISIQG